MHFNHYSKQISKADNDSWNIAAKLFAGNMKNKICQESAPILTEKEYTKVPQWNIPFSKLQGSTNIRRS